MLRFLMLAILVGWACIGQAGDYSIYSIGNTDFVQGSNGYSGSGRSIGNTYFYNDNEGNSYSTRSLGNTDFTSGSNGYSGSGCSIGNTYFYNDNDDDY